MSESIYKESYKDLLGVMAKISIEMPEIITLDYFDKFDANNKYLLSLFIESYKSALIVCESMNNVCIAQAAVVLRLLLESVSLIRVLTKYPELQEKYIDHYKIRLKIGRDPKKEWKILEEAFPNVNKNKRLSYMDYGWFESKLQTKVENGELKVPYPNETELIKLAGFDDIISWKKLYLDKLSHQSYTIVNMIDDNSEIPIIVNFIEILCKLFDYLCCDFHNLTKFAFVFEGKNLFLDEFKKLYTLDAFK